MVYKVIEKSFNSSFHTQKIVIIGYMTIDLGKTPLILKKSADLSMTSEDNTMYSEHTRLLYKKWMNKLRIIDKIL